MAMSRDDRQEFVQWIRRLESEIKELRRRIGELEYKLEIDGRQQNADINLRQ